MCGQLTSLSQLPAANLCGELRSRSAHPSAEVDSAAISLLLMKRAQRRSASVRPAHKLTCRAGVMTLAARAEAELGITR